jgi:acetyl esterase/lipase
VNLFSRIEEERTMKRRALMALAGVALATLALRAPAQTAVRIEKDVDYLGPGHAEKADLYLPAEIPPGKRVPAVVIIHGGGFTGGKKDAARELNIGSTLAANGYVGMSIDYALAAPGRPTWPRNLHECKTAVRWLRRNAERLHVDPDRIGAIGGSAGGHLATMLALTGPDAKLDPKGPYGEYSCRVRCAVDLYGPAELRFPTAMIAGTPEQAPELYKQASPITHATPDDPPMLILHGTADTTVPYQQSELLASVLKKVGIKHELMLIEGAPHTFHLQPKQKDLRPVVLGFFDQHLKNPPRK